MVGDGDGDVTASDSVSAGGLRLAMSPNRDRPGWRVRRRVLSVFVFQMFETTAYYGVKGIAFFFFGKIS